MTETNNSHEGHHRIRLDPTRAHDTNHRPSHGTPWTDGDGGRQPPVDVIAHLVIALSRYLRHLRADAKRVPTQLEDLSIFLARHARHCQDVPPVDPRNTAPEHRGVPSRLLLTKREAAEQLAVSLRTIERLISAGRLPLVHVEGAARVRVADLETYVQGLESDDRTNPSPAE
jgi:excisionase family DNA binding protein